MGDKHESVANDTPDENGNNKKTKKNRDDHRHHAIDAIVVGMTTRSMLQKVSTAANQSKDIKHLFKKEKNGKSAIDPWDGFRKEVKSVVDNIIVSHRKGNKTLSNLATSGQLHNDTAYGIVKEQNGTNKSSVAVDKPIKVVVRKPVEKGKFSKKKSVESIRDERLRHQFLDAFEEDGEEGVISLARQKNIRGLRCEEELSIIPIKDKEGKIYKTFKGGSNWGYEIYEYPQGHPKEGEWEGVVIPTYAANQENFQPGVTFRPHPIAKLVMRLHVNDCIEITENGIKKALRLCKISNSLSFAALNEANVAKRNSDKETNFKYISKKGSSLKKLHARKIHISPTGLKNYENNNA